MRLSIFGLVCVLMTVGCGSSEPVSPTGQSGTMKHVTGHNEHLLCIVVDASDSFSSMMQGDDSAFDFILRVIQAYSQEYHGEEGRLVIAQIGRSNQGRPALIWEGKPSHLRRAFRTVAEFKEFVLKKSGDGVVMTPLYESLAETLEYVLGHGTVQAGSGVDVVVVSDFVDTTDQNGQQRQRLIASLAQLHDRGAACGVYYADVAAAATVRELLRQSGYESPILCTNLDRYPPEPTFQR